MLADPRGKALTQNFVGQWLEVRDLDGIYFNERAILRREGVRLKGADTERNVLTRDSAGPCGARPRWPSSTSPARTAASSSGSTATTPS